MPLSDNNEVAVLAGGRVACVIESYDERVHCVDREGVADDGPLMHLYEVDIASGETVREDASRGGPWDVECGRVINGIPDRRGGWGFLACGGYLVFDEGAGSEATVVRAPTYVEEFPDERDVARRREEIESLNRAFAELGLEPSESVEEQPHSIEYTSPTRMVRTRCLSESRSALSISRSPRV